MTDIYGYAAAAPLYRAAGWMQVIPLPEGARPHHPAVSLDAAANPSPTSRCGSGRSRIRLRTRASSSPKAYWFWTSTPNKGTRSRQTGRKASANSARSWEHCRPRGAARRTASIRRHATCSTRCPKLAWKGGAIEGVDILQPGHRYSVVWPSIHPSGEMYCWYTPSGSTTSQIPHISDLATLPWKWWIICANRSIRRRDQLLIP